MPLFSKYLELLRERARLMAQMKAAQKSIKRYYLGKIDKLTIEMDGEARTAISTKLAKGPKNMVS